MKIYTTGLLSFIAAVATMVCYIERMQNFIMTNSRLFWCGQVLFAIILVIMSVYIVMHWDNKEEFSKIRFVISLFIICLLYAIAWTSSKYSWLFILVCSTVEMYSIRNKAGLVKKRK